VLQQSHGNDAKGHFTQIASGTTNAFSFGRDQTKN
jgi:hypothetical protein